MASNRERPVQRKVMSARKTSTVSLKRISRVQPKQKRLPAALKRAVLQHGVRRSRFVLCVSVAEQSMALFEKAETRPRAAEFPTYEFRRRFVISTSRFGIGQVMHSNRTPLGLHRIARKVGGDCPEGTVFKARKPIGHLSGGMPEGAIVHRILWLDGLEPGKNRGGNVDTFNRYIYIHGYWDEATLGRPQSMGCIHLAAADLIPLYDELPVGTLLWIARR